jgi:hypothetical protein
MHGRSRGESTLAGRAESGGSSANPQQSMPGQGHENDFFVHLTVNSSGIRQHLNQWRQG